MLKSRVASLCASKVVVLALFATLAAAALSPQAIAQTKVWTGAGGDFSWHNANNWDPVGVPGAGDDVLIDVPEQITVAIASSATVGSLTLATDVEVVNVQLTIHNDLTLDDATMTLTRTGGASSNGTLQFSGGTQTLGGFGEVLLNVNTDTNGGGVIPSSNTTVIIGPGVTISRVGTTGIGNAYIGLTTGTTIVNQGAIISETTFRRIRLRGNWTNHGTLRAANTGWLVLDGSFATSDIKTLENNGGVVSFAGELDNTDSILALDATGSWRLDSGTIAGGVINLAGGATLRPDGSQQNRLVGVTVNGDIDMSAGSARLGIEEGLMLNGSVTMGGGGSNPYGLAFHGGDQTLSGDATVNFSPGGTSSATPSLRALDGSVVTIDPSVTITGNRGNIAGDSGTGAFINHGTMIANAGFGINVLHIQSSLANFINNGTIKAVNANAELRISPNWTNQGVLLASDGGIIHSPNSESTLQNLDRGVLAGGTYIVEAGSTMNFGSAAIHTNNADITIDGAGSFFNALNSLEVNQGVFTVSGDRVFTIADELHNHGELRGDGALNGIVIINHGTIIPGSAAAPMLVTGVLELTADGEVIIEADDADSPATWSPRLDVAGDLLVAGHLTPVLPKGFFDNPGTEITIIEADLIDGTFDEVTVCVGYQVLYEKESIGLLLLELPDPADFNCDGVVGVADLLLLLAAWGPCAEPSNCPADLNGDDSVGVADLLILLANWG